MTYLIISIIGIILFIGCYTSAKNESHTNWDEWDEIERISKK